MKTIGLIQGSPEWCAHRANHFNASDAPAMMGCSPYQSRAQLLARMATGITAEVDAGTQRRFDDGHRFEALARPLAEKIIGEDLYPVTGASGQYSASFDGLTMLEDVAFEHKTLNAELRAVFDDMETMAPEYRETFSAGRILPLMYRVQMEHQAMVSGCERILFMASEWDANDRLIAERHCWYKPDPELRAKIIAGWAQLAEDLKTYTPASAAGPAPTGRAPDTLPALRIEVTGMVTASNLAEFKETALTAIRGVNRELTTDQDFADAEQSVKWCEEVETRLKAAKEHALSQTTSIDQLFKAIDDISAEARKVRLELEKLVKGKKEELRGQIVRAAQEKLSNHVSKLNDRIGWINGCPVLSVAQADFASAVKGKRSLASIQDAVDTELAHAKIAASEVADRMEANIKSLTGEAHDWSFLFPDLAAVASKTTEDFANLLTARVAKYRQDQEDARQRALRMEAERQAREAEAAAKAAAVAAATIQQAQAPIAQAMTDAMTGGTGILRMDASQAARIDPAQIHDTGERIKLGDINARLAPITLTADGLAQLGFVHVATDKSAKLYRESDFAAICTALINHIQGAVALA